MLFLVATLELAEKKFRDTPVGHKKYHKRLIDYINLLISKSRVIEAKHYFSILEYLKPSHHSVMRIGYFISISLFDKVGVEKYDRLFVMSKTNEVEIFYFRLMYYLSVNNLKNCEDCSVFILSKKFNQKQLDIIMQACFNLNSYVIARAITVLIRKKKVFLNEQGIHRLKRVLLQHLANKIMETKNA